MSSIARREHHVEGLIEAWDRAGLEGHSIHEVETIQDERRRSVYRLHFRGDGLEPVIAKRAPSGEANNEITFYAMVLPCLNLPTLRYFGSTRDRQEDEVWIFIEDAGGIEYDPDIAEHRNIAGSWLGSLHVAGASKSHTGFSLPDRGPTHFGTQVKNGRACLEQHLFNPALDSADVDPLRALLDRVIALESSWPCIVEYMSTFPTTFVHGDFKPDNLRIRVGKNGTGLVVFDWNNGGCGVPALDLSRFLISSPAGRSPGDRAIARFDAAPSIHRLVPDINAYLAHVHDVWPEFDRPAVERLGHIGELFHCVTSIRWEAARLAYSWREGPIANLRIYHDWLGDLMRALEL
jgi:hypothetical protein